MVTDSCIGFFGDKQRFPSELIPRDNSWTEHYVHHRDVPLVLVEFSRAEWMRSISNFRRWAVAQRAAAGYEDSFVEDAIARQGDALTAEIVAWAERTIPKYEENELQSPSNDLVNSKGYGYYDRETIPQSSPTFLHFPRATFQDKTHSELNLTYYGLLLLVSYSAYPHGGHLPYSRWQSAVKFCRCFAAHPAPEEMGIVNRVLHLFFARLTFDESFPRGISTGVWLI
jgi:hypothetical protein